MTNEKIPAAEIIAAMQRATDGQLAEMTWDRVNRSFSFKKKGSRLIEALGRYAGCELGFNILIDRPLAEQEARIKSEYKAFCDFCQEGGN